MDHKTLIASLTRDQRAALTAQTDADGLRHLALHAGLIAVGAALIVMDAPLLGLVMLVQGVLIVFLFTLLHETLHRTPFRTDAINIWVGRACGLLTFLGPEWFRYFHLAHHKYTHDPDRDPELASPKPQTLWQYTKYLSGLPDTASRNATRPNTESYIPNRAQPRIMREARVMLGIYATAAVLSLAFWTHLLVQIWLLPVLLGTPFLRAYLLAEHSRCPHDPSMLRNTRTTITTRFVRFIAWNMPYHAEHHAYPAVPFHKLPALHAHTAPHLAQHQGGYLPFNATYARDAHKGVL